MNADSYLNKISPEERENLFRLIKHENLQIQIPQDQPMTSEELRIHPNTVSTKNTVQTPASELMEFSQIEREVQCKYSQAIKIQNINEATDIIKNLQSSLKKQADENNSLREQIIELQNQMANEKKIGEDEQKNQDEIVTNLNLHLEDLMKDNLKMKKEIQYLERSQSEFKTQNTTLHQSLQNLREFASALVRDLQLTKKKDPRELKLLNNLEVDNFLFQSEPPIEYELPEMPAEKNIFSLRNEIERLNIEIRNLKNEKDDAENRCEKAEEERDKFRIQKLQIEKESNSIIQQLKNQNIGAIRRINYLTDEKKNLEANTKKKENYIAKLEYQIIQQNVKLKNLESRIRDLSNRNNISLSQQILNNVTNHNIPSHSIKSSMANLKNKAPQTARYIFHDSFNNTQRIQSERLEIQNENPLSKSTSQITNKYKRTAPLSKKKSMDEAQFMRQNEVESPNMNLQEIKNTPLTMDTLENKMEDYYNEMAQIEEE